MEYNITKENLEIDLREIKHILETRMASEYVELSMAKKEIVKRLMKHLYPKNN